MRVEQRTYLDIGTAESRDGEARGDLACVFGRRHHNVSDKRYLQESAHRVSPEGLGDEVTNQITNHQEPASTQKIRVRTAAEDQ